MIAYIITGEDGEVVPGDATHVSVHPSVKVIPAYLFYKHPNIVELICHDGVERIKEAAFYKCRRLKRVIIRGVKVAEDSAFLDCDALEYVECLKLEIIGEHSFDGCKSLSNINAPSAKIVDRFAFGGCEALTDMKFGKELESFRRWAFYKCRYLERITIPLKNGLFTNDNIFQKCVNLKRVDLVEGAILRQTIAALLLDEWRNEMNREIDSINHSLPNARAGYYHDEYDYDVGEKAITIREWIRCVLNKMINYKAQHRRLLSEAASALQRALPNDIVTNHVVPFLELPLHTFDGEDEDNDREESVDNSEDFSEYTYEDDDDGDGSEYTFEDDDDGEEAKDGDNNHSVDGGEDKEEQHQQDDEGGRKRRKTANDYDEERGRTNGLGTNLKTLVGLSV